MLDDDATSSRDPVPAGDDAVSENGSDESEAAQLSSVAKEHSPGGDPQADVQADVQSKVDTFLRNVTASLELAAVFLDPDL
ncbi:MAG: hypothetical protein BRD44_05760, partial [Bacteroidetes bacterium QS_7_67_15]